MADLQQPARPATVDHVALTLDGSLDGYGSRPDQMRWLPPEHAAPIRDADCLDVAEAHLMAAHGIPASRSTR